jgi:uncharacterized membrane protein YhhN
MVLLGLAFLVAAVDWLALQRGWTRVDYLAKPGVMLLLILAVARYLGQDPSGLLLPFAAGLAFSMVGDVLLMLPRERFLGGLGAFLLAHLAYIMAFNRGAQSIDGTAVVLALFAAAAAWWLFGRILAGLRASGRRKLQAPVLAYGTVITAMLVSAWRIFGRANWSTGVAALVAVGALLFYLSDVLLAWERFVSPIQLGRPGRRMLYQLGQISMTAGVLSHFLNLN